MNMMKFKKNIGLIFLMGVMFFAAVLPTFLSVKAEDANPKLVVQANNNNNIISIDTTDTQKLIYKINDTVVGSAKVKYGEAYLTPALTNGQIEYTLTAHSSDYQVNVEVTPADGYQAQQNYFYDGTSTTYPANNILDLNITSNKVFNLDLSFEEQSNPEPEPEPITYPIKAYFNGVNNGVTMNENGSIIIPDGWTNGTVSFKAKVCEVNGQTVPNNGKNTCDADSSKEVELVIEGIANSSQIDSTVIGSNTRKYITIAKEFADYGNAIIHLTGDNAINSVVSICTKDLVTITANAKLDMSLSVGSTSYVQAIITKDIEKDLSVFFGNNETTLVVAGYNVNKITSVIGGKSVVLNNDGSATVKFPDLSVETTTQVKVAILLNDNTTITRTINLKRTAIMLNYDKRTKQLRAGYVMNKGYLYKNQNHDDSIFNAYLQVILYKNDKVAGYKQIKIDDEKIVNRLGNNEAWSIETFDNNPIIIYDGSQTGINGASVFLTNGPINASSNTLPSIEYGIGAGVKLTWEAE